MDAVIRMLAGLVRGLAGLLGEHRRDWVHALLAETDDLPARSARLAWLGGGLLLVTREVLMSRIIQALAFVAGAVGLVWIAWPGASTNSATPVNRMYVVGILVLLAGLPLLVRRYVGPVRVGWAPLSARLGGYAVVLALVAATAVQQRIGNQLGAYFPVIAPVWAMDVGFLLILAGYVAGLLVLTSRRVQFTRRILPAALGIGALTAGVLFALAPFGIGGAIEAASHSLHGGPAVPADYLLLACFALAALAIPVTVHAMATRLADRDNRPGLLTPAWQALLATGAAMATAAILVALFTTATAALLPHQVPLQPAAVCPACDPRAPVVPTNLRHEYQFEESVGSSGDGGMPLWFVPLIGILLGALRGHLRYYTPPAPQPKGLPERA
ncbi:hypothetical protein [Planosporangium mesophilum]|uniref:Uncharacterized protein n=1 Tax=Planosporangium mesophilum TaxID=689768 RepID=A0A8J3X388_9ACTN|nr:hypothetical protein [Planosporangium mesophilum]NJC81999.1 hypothetical protein [Planosporangium mesophilum]GII25234.1 hypothetical protein Pme01_48310 [Planosporangium mesophilum]